MRSTRLIPLLFTVAAFMAVPLCETHAAPPAAPAPTPAPAVQPVPRVAIANASVIFKNMRERTAMTDKLEERRKQLAAKDHELHDEIEHLIQERDQYKPTHPKYTEISEQIDLKKAEYQAWGLSTKASVERQQKVMVKTLYDKIETAVAVVAQQNNIDLVIADGRRDVSNLEDLSPDDLQRLLNTRAVLYSNKAVDITEMVIAVLDQQFAAGVPAGNVVPPPLPK